jgi:hypothetical protein
MAKSMYMQNDLESEFFETCCPKVGDICMFLTSLHYKCEELVAMGVHVTNKEYQCTILCDIPEELAKFTSQLLLSTKLTHNVMVIDTNTLIDHICKEVDQLKNCHTWGQQNQGGGRQDGQTDEALTATRTSGGNNKCCKGKCHNCGKPGHWARECHSPRKNDNLTASAMQVTLSTLSMMQMRAETRPVGSVNTVIKTTKGDGFWMAKEIEDHMQIIGADPDLLLQDVENLKPEECMLANSKKIHFAWSGPEDWVHEEEQANWLQEEGEIAAAIIMPVEEG